MITILNRKKLITTFSMEQQAAVRNILAANNIDYTFKTTSRNDSSAYNNVRARTGNLAPNPQYAYEYIIYVNKKDYETAVALINGHPLRHDTDKIG